MPALSSIKTPKGYKMFQVSKVDFRPIPILKFVKMEYPLFRAVIFYAFYLLSFGNKI